MMQKKYYLDERGKKVYEKIKENAKNITINGLERLSDTNNLKLYDDLLSVKTEITELQEAVDNGKQREVELQTKNEKIYIKSAKVERNFNEAVGILKSYVELNKCHERLVQEVPVIRKKNSGTIRVQTWEGAVECYMRDNSKPKVTEVNVDDFGSTNRY